MPASTAEAPEAVAAPAGGSFLIRDASESEILAPEDFNEAQDQVRATTLRFMNEEVLPRADALEQKEEGLTRELFRQSGELGLLGVLVPEAYGGLEMDLTTQMLVSECLGAYASISTTYGAHAGIGTLPVVFFGSEEQKRKYLPKLVAGEWMAAYCLSEPQAGSDALATLTKAELAPDGKHYFLNGQKMWISNGGWADLYTVFAKVDGEHFTAFLVERTWEGVKAGEEERKMGLHGSSTTPLYLDNVQVPVENVLGEIGRGHVIAFNVLNLGRLSLGASCIGGAKDAIGESASYATQRKAFGKAIAEFGLIRQKLADMTVRTFAGESLIYRTSGLIDARLEDFSWDAPDAARTALKAVEEYAIECSIAKVYLSEAMDYIADEAVQIHGGYGFHADYSVERAYRDSRINRIFEGTNEINRLLTTGMLLKHAAQGRLDLLGAIAGAAGPSAPAGDGPLPRERGMLARAKQATLTMAGMAYERFGEGLEHEQEVAAALADMAMGVYALECSLLRAEKLLAAGRDGNAADILTVLADQTTAQLRELGSLVIGACAEGPDLEAAFAAFSRLTDSPPANLPAARDRIAGRVLASSGYAQ